MSAKRIEQIEPTISSKDQLQGNELFIVSAVDENAVNETGYSTKKMDIQTLKDYIFDDSSIEDNVRIGNVLVVDNYNNTVDLILNNITPSDATVTYATSSEYDPFNIQQWDSVIDGTATITFTEQIDKETKYVFFKVSSTNYPDNIYMMLLLQNYSVELQNVTTKYQVGQGKGYSSSFSEFSSFVNEHKSENYEYYNYVDNKWVKGGIGSRYKYCQVIMGNDPNEYRYIYRYPIQQGDEIDTYLHSILIQLTNIEEPES